VRSATAAELVALCRKYRTLAVLRRDKERDGKVAPPSALRELSREFPGALRELDTLPLDEIDRRVTALDRAGEGAAPLETWMTWMTAYHATMKAALLVKARVARRPGLDAAAVEELAAAASEKSGVVVDVAFRARGREPAGWPTESRGVRTIGRGVRRGPPMKCGKRCFPRDDRVAM